MCERWRSASAAERVLLGPGTSRTSPLTGELFTAVGAQKEALRLDPASPLHRENLVRLLTVPYREFVARRERGGR